MSVDILSFGATKYSPLFGSNGKDVVPNAALPKTVKVVGMTEYSIGWLVAALVCGIDVVWIAQTGYSFAFPVQLQTVVGIALLILAAFWIHFRLKQIANRDRWAIRLSNVANLALWMLLLLVFCVSTSVLVSLAVALDAPLIDNALIRFDRTLGFNWVAWYQSIRSHPLVSNVFHLAYASGIVQMVAIPVYFGLTGRREELTGYVMRFMLATLLCVLIATPFPAASAFLHFHITDPDTASTVSSFYPLHDGTLRMIDLRRPQGLVSMPSMHTALAILFVYSLRNTVFLFRLAFFVDAIMLGSTLSEGGHYAADVISGIALALITIFLWARMQRIISKQKV